MFSLVLLLLTLLLLPAPVSGSCNLTKQMVEARDVKFLESTWNPGSDPEAPTLLQSGTEVEVMCSQEAYTFTNQVRRQEGVNLTWLDTWGTITATCDSASIYPNIFYNEDGSGDSYFDFYCRPGCSRLLESERTAVYPPQTATQEIYSAPVQHSNIAVTVKCNDGYAQAVGDGGKATISCNNLVGWDSSPDQLISCLPGCEDIRFDVSKGSTQTLRTGSDDEPPFKAGDIVKFTCDDSYTMYGYSTVTCSGTNVWSYDLPTCVFESSSAALVARITISALLGFVLKLLYCVGV